MQKHLKFLKIHKVPFWNKQLSKGYILSYLYYDNGTIRYNGIPKSGRFKIDINDKTLFFTHSTGKSIISYMLVTPYVKDI